MLVAQLITANQQRSSVRALLGEEYQLLGRKVVERSAGDRRALHHARVRDYFGMWRMAAGGGSLDGRHRLPEVFHCCCINKFVEGVVFRSTTSAVFWSPLAHFTLATKQPAATAPALAQKLDDVIGRRRAVLR